MNTPKELNSETLGVIRVTHLDSRQIVFDLENDRARSFPAPHDTSDAGIVAYLETQVANPPVLTITLAQAEALLDRILDEWAAAKGYASAARCITYAADPDPTFSAEGTEMLNARSAVWVAARAAVGSHDTPPFTEAGVRAFAAPFAPSWITS